jgi:aconitate hydratase
MSKLISQSTLTINNKNYYYFSLPEFASKFNVNLNKLPFSLKILLENILRTYQNVSEAKQHCLALINSVQNSQHRIEIAFSPARVLMQDFTGVPAVVDLATMRDAVAKLKQDPKKINPLVPVDLVIDHSVQVDYYANNNALAKNTELEFVRNFERYKFLKWAQKSFNNFRVVPPGTGICHQVNLENLASVVFNQNNNIYFDTVVGTDSHTTMINGLGVLGWGVGGIEAEAAMLGQPVSMLIPEVIGFKLIGKLNSNITATDLVLTITQILRQKSVVGKFVEFFGQGLQYLSLADRATIANMAPEYGATCGIFPIDQITLNYLYLTGRNQENIDIVSAYINAQQLNNHEEVNFSQIIELDLSTVIPSLAGPKRPQDKITLAETKQSLVKLAEELKISNNQIYPVNNLNTTICNGDLVIAAITSCTNTSNPSVLISAGLLAKKAVEKGLKVNSRVKTSLAPGSQVAVGYLTDSGLQQYLDQLGFNVVGYGCTTCIGNSGPLLSEIEETIKNNNLLVSAVLSGNRNFEGRIHSLVKANYLASPPLVVAYALAGTCNIDLSTQEIGRDKNNKPVYLVDIWPTDQEIETIIQKFINRDLFIKKYHNLFVGNADWQNISVQSSDTYNWQPDSTYIRLPNYFNNIKKNTLTNINNASILAIFGDSITTDHISPAGNIASNSPAAIYLNSKNVNNVDFNSYGARRGNHEVMIRGTFANTRIKNKMFTDGKEGGFTYNQQNQIVSIYDASCDYQQKNIPLVIFAGKEYGTGSSRDWAAKGTALLGVKAIIAESFERIHRSNLIGMGVLPLLIANISDYQNLQLTGKEKLDISNIDINIKPRQEFQCFVTMLNGECKQLNLICGLDTTNEVEYFKSGGILQYVINQILNLN